MAIFMHVVGAFVILLLAWIVFVLIVFKKEVDAVFDRDPAARNYLEVVLLYAGLQALVMHRIAHALYRVRIPFLPRWLSQVSRFFTGIEIHPAAQIGDGLFIDHGMGVVIGETSVVGKNVTLYQGVTLGGTGKEKGKRHPNIGDNVVIGTGAKVLGNITVGENSYIGANAVVLRDVPPNATVVGVPGHITRQDGKKIDRLLDHIHVLDPLMQSLEELEERIKDLEKKLK
ncbi:MAG: serine O-acetyltransferase EpsC [Candidatus Omnitrophota bacterium]|jgi:serine O-acetyltransferase|nr:serine O-acetyltransferase [Candidatus Omnitrophota bacterium]MDD5137686.1 serine O-acetyltransferase [Candidatus Omnitrophota bacterium]MDD5537836.1 serine O-acetyltransferase [Candidatus Omnitrophota bacterium]